MAVRIILCIILIDISPKSDYNILCKSEIGQYPTGSDDLNRNSAAESFCEFNRVYKETNDIYRRKAADYGLSESAFWILYSVREGIGKVTQSRICFEACLPKQTVNSALKKLEADGVILLIPEIGGRGKVIELTEKGTKLAEATVDNVLNAEKSAMSKLSDDEQRQLIGLTRRYFSLMNEFISREEEKK